MQLWKVVRHAFRLTMRPPMVGHDDTAPLPRLPSAQPGNMPGGETCIASLSSFALQPPSRRPPLWRSSRRRRPTLQPRSSPRLRAPLQAAQQQRMSTCNADASQRNLKADARQTCRSACLGGKMNQNTLMKVCNAQAGQDKLTSDGRKAYMSTCLKKSSEALIVSRAVFFCAALAAVLCAAVPSAFTGALADSGGYRRPAISAPSGSVWSAPSGIASSSGGYRRPSTTGGGYASGSAGDVSISRTAAAQALQQYRAAQQTRRPPVAATASPDAAWGAGGYVSRRPPSYAAPAGFPAAGCTAAFWAMLGALSASDRAAYFRQSQADPAYQQWRQQAIHEPDASARLAALGDNATAAPIDAGATAAVASGGSGIVWLVLFVAVAAFALLWLARRRGRSPARHRAPHRVSPAGGRHASVSDRPCYSIRRHSCSPRA